MEEEYNYYPIDISKTQDINEPSFNVPAQVINNSNITPSSNGSIMGCGTLESPNFSHNNSGWRIDSNGNVEFGNGQFRGDITGASGTFSGTITATTGSIGGFTIASNALYAGTGATRIGLDTTSGIYLGSSTFATAPFNVSLAGILSATSGTVGGWDMTSSLLRSALSGVRVELDKDKNRISIFDATNEKVVMGYLDGLPKHDDSGNWGAGNYGFWARTGDMLSIDGDSEYVSGDWLIQNDASYLVKDSSNNTIIRLGTDTGEKGLFIYSEPITGILVDSYSESNQNSGWYNLPEISFGQSFTGDGNILDYCKFYLRRIGSPTGNAYAKIYAHTGTFGIDGKPTGSAIATSSPVDVSTISTSNSLITFYFTGVNQIPLINGTNYFVVWSFADVGATTNYISVGTDNTPSDSGNSAYSTDDINWTTYSSYDIIFYIYGKEVNGTQLAKFISDEINIGNTLSYLNYTVTGGLKLYSNESDALTFDAGSNILLKEGGDIKFTRVVKPTACTATLINTATGNVDNYTWKYSISFLNANGETELSDYSNEVTVDASNKQVSLTNIAISSSSGVNKRNIYRYRAGISSRLVTTINDNTTTTYTDNIAEVNLGKDAQYLTNSTEGGIFIDGVRAIRFGEQVSLGDGALQDVTQGTENVAIGHYAIESNTTGSNNSGIGSQSLRDNTTGGGNSAFGFSSSANNITGNYNVAIGGSTLYLNEDGDNNVAIGNDAGWYIDGNRNIVIGNYAGFYETGSDSFYINNQDRTNTAGDKAGSILYGVMSDTPTSQRLKINANLTVNAVNYAADAGANDTYVITLDPILTAYITGQQIIFKANTANTGAATLNVNGLGEKTIVKAVSTALANNDILASMFCLCVYNGTNFVLMNPRTL